MPQAPANSNDAGSVCDAPLSTAALVPSRVRAENTRRINQLQIVAPQRFFPTVPSAEHHGRARCTGRGIAGIGVAMDGRRWQ